MKYRKLIIICIALMLAAAGCGEAPREEIVDLTPAATAEPTPERTEALTPRPTPTAKPTPEPTSTARPTPEPTPAPTIEPTPEPTPERTEEPAATPERAGSPEERVAELVNLNRAERGLSSLRMNDELNRAAATRAREIVGLFAHTRPDGSEALSVSPLAYGENIAMGTGMDAEMAMSGWMDSEGHRENILREGYAILGVGYYEEGGIGYWVQLFGY